jgi:hypothetical protein
VDLRSLSLGERIAAVCGVVLFVLTFVPWLEQTDASGASTAVSAWTLFAIVDVLLVLLALAAAALPLARAAGAELPIRPSNKTILTRIGLVTLAVTVAFFLEGDKAWGIWLAVLASAGILYGAMTMPEEEGRSPRRRERARPPAAGEGYEEPPPGMERWRETVGDLGEEEPSSGRAPAGRRDRGSEPPDLDAEGPPRARRERARPTWDDDEPWGSDEPRREREPGETGSSSAEGRGRRRPPEVPRSEEP